MHERYYTKKLVKMDLKSLCVIMRVLESVCHTLSIKNAAVKADALDVLACPELVGVVKNMMQRWFLKIESCCVVRRQVSPML